jgi:hypothetical protein
LVLFDLPQDAVICRITSVLHTGPMDVLLIGWQAAGLLKPSVARLDRIAGRAQPSDTVIQQQCPEACA